MAVVRIKQAFLYRRCGRRGDTMYDPNIPFCTQFLDLVQQEALVESGIGCWFFVELPARQKEYYQLNALLVAHTMDPVQNDGKQLDLLGEPVLQLGCVGLERPELSCKKIEQCRATFEFCT